LRLLLDRDPVPTQPAPPEIGLQFECGYDILLSAYWISTGPKVLKVEHAAYPTKWIEKPEEEDLQKRYKIELKPQVGDDFPGVLRQMKRTDSDTLVIGSFNARGCTLDQVRKMFASNNIKIVTLEEIQAIKDRVWLEAPKEENGPEESAK
jgi:hypothetical protein